MLTDRYCSMTSPYCMYHVQTLDKVGALQKRDIAAKYPAKNRYANIVGCKYRQLEYYTHVFSTSYKSCCVPYFIVVV